MILLLTENGCTNSYNAENDWSNNRSHIEIMQGQARIDGVNRNAKIIKRRKRHNCQKHKFAKCFPLVCHFVAFLSHEDIKIDCRNEDTRLGIPGIFKKESLNEKVF